MAVGEGLLSKVFAWSIPSVLLMVRWFMLKKVPGVTTLWGWPFLEVNPS
jgi:hypothetical protein